MARMQVSEILSQIASSVNQESTAPVAGSSEFSLWMSYLNRSQDEYDQAVDWEKSRKYFYPGITGASLASISLPDDFRKIAGPIKLFSSDRDTPIEYNYMVNENESMYDKLDKFFTLTGNNTNGYTAVMNPKTLPSGASVQIQYFSYSTSLATTTQYVPMSDPQFAVERTIAYIFRARSDPRFQQVEASARERLSQMEQNENYDKWSSYAGAAPIHTSMRRKGYRMGTF